MLSSLLFSVNAVVPIFIVVFLGWLLKRIGFLHPPFFDDANKLMFRVSLPCMLFADLATADISKAFNLRLILFCCCTIVAIFLILCLIVPLFVREDARRGAVIQGIYRSNFAILAMTLMENMFGEEGTTVTAAVMPFAVILFNVLAVIVLSIFAPKEKKLSFPSLLKKILLNIVTNPLIIALVISLPFMFFRLPVPPIVGSAVGYLGNATMALALLCLGANVDFASIRKNIATTLAASAGKLVLLPTAATLIAAFVFGFRGYELALVFLLFGCPTAVSSFVMAKSMGSDHKLAGEILLTTTLLSLFTLFFGIFILRACALI